MGKKGVVRDPAIHEAVVSDIVAFAPSFGYSVTQLDFSPVTGPEGNIEYLAELLPGKPGVGRERIAEVVASSHQVLAKN